MQIPKKKTKSRNGIFSRTQNREDLYNRRHYLNREASWNEIILKPRQLTFIGIRQKAADNKELGGSVDEGLDDWVKDNEISLMELKRRMEEVFNKAEEDMHRR